MSHIRSRGVCTNCIPLAIIVAVVAFVLLMGPCSLPESMAQSRPTTVPLVGEVTKVSVDEGLLVVKPDQGRRQQVFVTGDTEFVGVFTLKEIKKKQKVKVWYTVDNDELIAVRIEVAPELGC